MPGIGDFLRMMGRGMSRPFVSEDPILRQRMRRDWMTMPDVDPGNTDPLMTEHMVESPTGEYEQVGVRRSPSRLTRTIAGAAPGLLRGALVGANTPPSGVGFLDFTRAMQNSGDDLMSRSFRDREMGRQDRGDAMDMERHRAQMAQADVNLDTSRSEAEENRAMAGYRRNQAERAAMGPEQQIAAKVQALEQALGRRLTDRERLTATGLMGEQYDPRVSISNYESLLSAMAERAETPEQRAEILAKLDKLKAPAAAPFIRPQIVQTERGMMSVYPGRTPEETRTSPLTGSDGKPLMPYRAPARPRAAGGDGGISAGDVRARKSKVQSVVNRLLQEDSAHSPETTLQNISAFYQDDPEVQQYRSDIIAELQKLTKGAPRKSAGTSLTDRYTNKKSPASPEPAASSRNPFR